MKKILLILPEGWGNGGVQHVLMQIVRNLHDKYEFTALKRTNEIRFFDDEFLALGGKNLIVSDKIKYKLPSVLGKIQNRLHKYVNYIKCLKLIKKNEYDVMHINTPEGIFAFIGKVKNIQKIVAHNHTNYKIGSFQKKLLNKYSNVKISVADYSKYSVFEKKSIENSDVKIIYNPIDLVKFDRLKYDKNNSKTCRLINVASYNDNKNQIFLVELAKKLKEKNFDFSLKLVGWGEYGEKIKCKIHEYNLSKEIVLVDGLKADIPYELSQSDIFLLPSKAEGFAIVLLEAQAMNIPYIASSNCPKEPNIGLGTYLTLNDINQWVDKIVSIKECNNLMLDDNKLKLFDMEVFIKKIEDIYE